MRRPAALRRLGRSIVELVCTAVLLAAIVSDAACADADLDRAIGQPDERTRLLAISEDLRASFDAMSDLYAREAAERAYDPVAHVRRCRFLDTFAGQYEYVEWIDEVYALAERCREAEGWRLRHAWAALFVLGIASFFALYTAGSLQVDLTSSVSAPLRYTQVQVGRIAVAQSFLLILGLLPLAAAASRLDARPWSSRWTVTRSVVVALLLAGLLRLPALILWLTRPELVPPLMPDNAQAQMLIGVRDAFGVAAAFWLVTIAAPVTEELVFRGALLRAFSSHVAFGWANLLQAAIFAAMHMNLAAFPLLLALGAIAGFLAKRSGGLLAPMTLHALFNLISGIILLT